jgi:MFS superfamily sulfate permease-like transporter
LLYFNMNYVRDTIEERVRAETETKLVVLDLSEVSIVDMHAAEMLAGLAGELASKGIKIQAGKRTRRCATGCAAKDWRRDSAGSNGCAPPPTWRTTFCEGVSAGKMSTSRSAI